jgi:hypothetical protein
MQFSYTRQNCSVYSDSTTVAQERHESIPEDIVLRPLIVSLYGEDN